MGLTSYSRATSPIRRYTDIVTHFQLKAHKEKKDLPFSVDDLKVILPRIQHLELEIKNLQQSSTRFWLFRYLEQEGNVAYPGIVLDTRTVDTLLEKKIPLLDIFLPTIGYKTSVRAGPKPIGTEVKVGFVTSSPYTAQFIVS